MIPKPLTEITSTDIGNLVTEQRMEDQTLDYKSELPDTGGKASRDLLADVAALANAYGGDLVYGVVERRDGNKRATGIPEQASGVEVENIDLKRSSIESAVRMGLDPTPNFSTHFVEGFPKGPCLILRVDRALNGPLMVRSSRRFHVRKGSHNVQLERTDDIRNLFAGIANLAESVRRFRSDRLALIARGEAPIAIPGNRPVMILHSIPTSIGATPQMIDLAELQAVRRHLMALGSGGWAYRPNLDGELVFPASPDLIPYYGQLFRNGAIEIVDSEPGVDIEKKTIAGQYLNRQLLRHLDGIWQATKELRVGLPTYVSISLMNVKGYHLLGSDSELPRIKTTFDRFLVSAEIEIADWPGNFGLGVKPVLDLIWQAAGFQSNPYIDGSGNARDC